MAALCFRADEAGVTLSLRVTPGARKAGLDSVVEAADGRAHGRMKVRAKAQDGAANAEVVETLAKALGRPRSAIEIAAGGTARLKTIRIEGAPAETAARLKEMFGP